MPQNLQKVSKARHIPNSGDIGVQKSKIEICKSNFILSKYLKICVDKIACMTLAILSAT